MESVAQLLGGVGLVWGLLSLLSWQRRRREPTAWDVLMHRPGTDWRTGRPLKRDASDGSPLSPSASWDSGGDAGCTSDTGSYDW